MTKVHLVDATYELFRMYFGAPPHRSPDGREVGAVRGVLTTLLILAQDEGATHIGCATDRVIRSFRNDLFAGYKTDAGIDPDLYAQFPLLEEGIEALGMVLWPMVDFEADDAMAAAAAKLEPVVEQVVLATVDKDLAQCVRGGRVVMLDRRRGNKVMDEAGVVEKFGVPPALIPDLLALVGDSADGYPGLRGFGMKSAAALLRAFGPLEDIPPDPARLKGLVRGAERLASTLAECRDEALLYKRLATLRTDAPIPQTLEDLEWRGATAALRPFAEAHGLADVVDRVRRWA